jgi:predicted signal transduction protein with EAL and GGDEF domain
LIKLLLRNGRERKEQGLRFHFCLSMSITSSYTTIFMVTQKGDDCLRAIAAALNGNSRPADVAARYGGEEFAVLMPECDHSHALSAAERLQQAVSAKRLMHGAVDTESYVTISIGVATEVPIEDMGSELLVNRADQALYAAKYSGRDRVLSAEQALASFGLLGTFAAQSARKVSGR